MSQNMHLLLVALIALSMGPCFVKSQGGYRGNGGYQEPYDNNPLTCQIPYVLHGEWFSRENGRNTHTTFERSESNQHGSCREIITDNNDNITMVFQHGDCFHCVRILVRTLNVLQKSQTGCLNKDNPHETGLRQICRYLSSSNNDMTTMFATNAQGKNCRSSIEGVWRFAYQNKNRFQGECRDSESNITACQKPGTQFHVLNQQFTMNYRKCPNVPVTDDAEVQYKCLGDWYVGKDHYFAVMNSRESREEEKYRCFLANRDDDTYLSVSDTAECNVLRTPQDGPERLHLIPVKAESVPAKCLLPDNFTGIWINTANFDAEVSINSTHMVEKWSPDTGRVKQEIFVCQERRDTRFVMARLGINGCQKDYICFEFIPRHHSIIRYRKGQAMSHDTFSTVCSWSTFDNEVEWMYSLMLKKDPVPIRCPVAGKFRFHQEGEIKFETRILGGVTQSPRPNVYCRENISDFSVCERDQRMIEIDAVKCISTDHQGRPVDIYSYPDYKMQCIGFYKENLKSYLITYDESDAFSKYRCWVYQRADLNKVLMSMAVGAFCHIKQDVTSQDASEGAQVALTMSEYEREHDDCGMYFDDGSHPWRTVAGSATLLNPGK